MTAVAHTVGTRSGRVCKRAIDLVVGCCALVCAAPIIALTAIAVKIDSRGPVLFRQERIGQGGGPFTMLKFRSMYADADDAAHRAFLASAFRGAVAQDRFKVERDPRITRVGRVIRATSIDELPQLVNVLRGDMSLVGPRPDVPYALVGYQPHHHRRFDVKPGITGLWQVSGRSSLSPVEMLELDIAYVDTWSVRNDLYLLWRTLPQLLRLHHSG